MLVNEAFLQLDPVADRRSTRHLRDFVDAPRVASICKPMQDLNALVEHYLGAERDLVAAVDAAGGTVPLPDGRTITVARAEYDASLAGRCMRAWVLIRRSAPMPPRR